MIKKTWMNNQIIISPLINNIKSWIIMRIIKIEIIIIIKRNYLKSIWIPLIIQFNQGKIWERGLIIITIFRQKVVMIIIIMEINLDIKRMSVIPISKSNQIISLIIIMKTNKKSRRWRKNCTWATKTTSVTWRTNLS